MAENQEQKNETSQATIDTIIAQRKNKADTMRAAKIDPYPARIKIDSKIAQVREKYDSLQKEEMSKDQVTVAGRMMSRRDMGKASFIDIADGTGRIQVYVRKDKSDPSAMAAYVPIVFGTATLNAIIVALLYAPLLKAIKKPFACEK